MTVEELVERLQAGPLDADLAKQAAVRIAVMAAALAGCDELFDDIRNDWTDPRHECRTGRDLVAVALKPTPA